MGFRLITFLSASETSFEDFTDCFILPRGDFSMDPVFGGERALGGSCLSRDPFSGTVSRSDWLMSVEDGALETAYRS